MIKDEKRNTGTYIILYRSLKCSISLPFKAYEEECIDKNGDIIW